MKEFNTFSKEDQKLICEALQIHSEAALKALQGIIINNDEQFKDKIRNMSYEAKEFLAETLMNSLPEEYRW